MVGPFTFLDIMGPEDFGPEEGINIDAHPHIGLSTLTYLVRGRAVHRDSTGAVQTIEPGAVNWMTAGSGVTHTERSHPDDLGSPAELFGAQLWVALPEIAENGNPSFEHFPADDVPTEQTGRTQVRVAAGSGWGLQSPVVGSSPLLLAEANLDESTLNLPTEHPERAVIAMTGGLEIDGSEIAEGSLAVLERDATPVLSGTGTALLIGGEPVGTRYIWWNFVHSDPDAIEDAKRRWLDQSFPEVPRDHESFVPLPSA
jgi:redox-sensitive bicupin YhaK (pirin superfamily)